MTASTSLEDLGYRESGRETVIAVDLGGTRLRLAEVRLSDGHCSNLRQGPTPKVSPDRLVESLALEIESMLLGEDGRAPIGLASPGPLDAERGVLHALPNLPGWEDYPMADRLAERTGRRVFVQNDASLAALGEARFGAGIGCSPLLYVTYSTGIGGGIVIDGKILGGANGLAGEIGHLIVEDGGPACGLGHAGCAEGIGSGSALAARARATHARSSLAGEASDATAIANAARAGDQLSLDWIERAARACGLAIAGGVNLLDPERVVVGGGVALGAWDLVGPPVMRAIEESVLSWESRQTQVMLAALGDRSGLVGAALYAQARACDG